MELFGQPAKLQMDPIFQKYHLSNSAPSWDVPCLQPVVHIHCWKFYQMVCLSHTVGKILGTSTTSGPHSVLEILSDGLSHTLGKILGHLLSRGGVSLLNGLENQMVAPDR